MGGSCRGTRAPHPSSSPSPHTHDRHGANNVASSGVPGASRWPIDDRNVDSVPNVNARIRNSGRRNIGSATRLLDRPRTPPATGAASRPAAPARFGEPQPIACVAVGPDPVGHRDHQQDQPERERDVARASRRCARLRRRQLAQRDVGPDRPGKIPTGTEIRNTRRQSIGARIPPRTSPMNVPDTPTMLLMPNAIPRWLAGNASAMIAAALASRHAPPTPWTSRMTIRYVAPRARPSSRRQQQRGDRVDDEAQVVDLDPADHVAQAAERDDQDAGHDQVAEDHPQQVERVGRDSGSRWMPRKMSGIAMIVIEPSSVASSTASVALDSATHL